MQQGNRRAVLTALLANLGIAIAKFTGFLVTGAASLAAEAVHSVADTSNQALLLWGGSAAARRATPSHPFGYGRERYFWAFVVALILFSLGSVFAIVEGVRKFIHPHELAQVGWAVGILLVAIGLEGYALRTAVVEARKVRGDRSWWRFVRETKNAELPVILLEDLGALVGLVLALLGVGLAQVTGNPRFDALGSIAIGILLGNIAWILAVEMKSLLIGEAASPETQATIERLICEDPSTERLVHMRTQHMGPDQLLVTARVEFAAALGFQALAEAIDAIQARIHAAIPITEIVYIEPDVAGDEPRHAEGGESHA